MGVVDPESYYNSPILINHLFVQSTPLRLNARSQRVTSIILFSCCIALCMVCYLRFHPLDMRVIIENNSADALRFAGDYIVNQISEYFKTETKPFTLVLPNPLPSMKPLSFFLSTSNVDTTSW